MEQFLAMVPINLADRAVAFVLVFGRIGTFMLTMPALGEIQIPTRVRLAAALSVSAFITPFGEAAPPQETWLALLVSEIALGLVFGLLLRSMLWALQFAGSLLAQATAILPPSTGALTPEPLPALGTIFLLSGIAVIFTTDLYLVFLQAALNSLTAAPPGALLASLTEPNAIFAHGTMLFWSAVSLSFPFLCASCAYYATIGLINRALPQLMVTFIGAPVLTGLAFAILWLQSPEILGVWVSHLENLVKELSTLG
ncbi:MAG: flagellar biosynthetic protein FliR [Pseudomonadota bacterium]